MSDNEAYNKAYERAKRLLKLWCDSDFLRVVRARTQYEAELYLYIKKLVGDKMKPIYFSKN